MSYLTGTKHGHDRQLILHESMPKIELAGLQIVQQAAYC